MLFRSAAAVDVKSPISTQGEGAGATTGTGSLLGALESIVMWSAWTCCKRRCGSSVAVPGKGPGSKVSNTKFDSNNNQNISLKIIRKLLQQRHLSPVTPDYPLHQMAWANTGQDNAQLRLKAHNEVRDQTALDMPS